MIITKWGRINLTAGEGVEETPEIRGWLDKVEQELGKVINSGDLDEEAARKYADLLVFGKPIDDSFGRED